MRWFRIFFSLFVLSLIATGASYYWKTYHPAGNQMTISMNEKAPAPGAAAPAGDVERGVQLSKPGTAAPDGGEAATSSVTQDLANMLSIVSSVVSLAGTVISLMFAMFIARRGQAS